MTLRKSHDENSFRSATTAGFSCARVICAFVFFTVFSAVFPIEFSVTLSAKERDLSREFYRILVRDFEHFDWTWNTNDAYVRYEKQQFEETVRRSHLFSSDRAHSSRAQPIRSVILRGELRDPICFEGTGRFEIQREGSSVALEPLGFWLVDPRREDGTKIHLGSNVTTSYLVFLETPEAARSNENVTKTPQEPETVEFQWSLRGRRDSQGRVAFDLSIPRSLYSVLELTIPEHWTPEIPLGIVSEIIEEDDSNPLTSENAVAMLRKPGVKKWRIFPGTRETTVLTLRSKDPAQEAKNRHSYRQVLAYDLRAEGLNVKSELIFDRPMSAARDLVLRSDSQLQILSVQCGSRALSWSALSPLKNESDESATEINDEPASVQRLLFTLPEGESRLIVHACASIPWNRDYKLPGVQLESPDDFWTETRADVLVASPMLLCDITPEDACQISYQDQTERNPDWIGEGYSFQYFHPDASVSLELTMNQPGVSWKSGTLVHWEPERITATLQLDLSSARGKSQLIELIVQDGWMIDMSSIEAFPKNEFLIWEGETNSETENEKTLHLFLTKPMRLKMTAHLPVTNSTSLNLASLLPVRVRQSAHGGNSGRAGSHAGEIEYGKHFVALTTTPSNQLKLSSLLGGLPQPIPHEDSRVRENFFFDPPMTTSGEVYLLDANARLVEVKLETMKLRYDSEIDSLLTLHGQELLQEYVFTIRPMEHRLDHIYVHFSQDSETPWEWTLRSGEATPPARVLSEEERKRLQLSAPPGGRIWEVQLRPPRNGPAFRLTASRRVHIDKPLAIPLAMLPESASDSIEIMIDAPYSSNVEILNTRLKAIPVAAPPKDEYQTLRAAFRYNPEIDDDSLDNPALFLRPASKEKTPFSAWVWSLQLDSMFETGGVVREQATFFIENRGQKQTTVTLPSSIRKEKILAVWIDKQRASWNLGQATDGHSCTITVTLPKKKRFTTVSVDYWRTEKPLVYRKKLRPKYPTIDLPVMNGTWIAWTPGEFQPFLRGRPVGRVSVPQREENEFQFLSEPGAELISDPVTRRRFSYSFDPFSSEDWQNAFSFDQRKTHCTRIARRWLEELGNERRLRLYRDRNLRETDDDGAAFTTGSPSFAPVTFKDVLGSEAFLESVFGDFSQYGSPTILVDWAALSRIGVFPTTQLQFSNPSTSRSGGNGFAGYNVLENAGLSILFFEERNVLITSALTAAKYQQELVLLNGDRVKLVREGPVSDLYREAKSGQPMPQWIPVTNWINRSAAQMNPWKDSSPSSRIAATVSGWNAIELQRTESTSGIYVAHRPTLSALSGFAFLFVILATRWKPLSRPGFLFVLLIIFGLLTKFQTPYYAILPGGAFFGTLFAIGFSLIRTEPFSKPIELLTADRELHTPYPDESSDAAYEVKELRPFHAKGSSHTRESFFDKLQDDHSGS